MDGLGSVKHQDSYYQSRKRDEENFLFLDTGIFKNAKYSLDVTIDLNAIDKIQIPSQKMPFQSHIKPTISSTPEFKKQH